MHHTVNCGQAPADERERSSLSHILSRKYPFLKRISIGHSRCGRAIEALSLGNEAEQVLYCGAFHGMEWLTSLLLYRFLDEICSAAQTRRQRCRNPDRPVFKPTGTCRCTVRQSRRRRNCPARCRKRREIRRSCVCRVQRENRSLAGKCGGRRHQP